MAVNCSFVTTVADGMLQISVVPKVGLAKINAKEQVIDLSRRVTTVSVETMKIIRQML